MVTHTIHDYLAFLMIVAEYRRPRSMTNDETPNDEGMTNPE